VFMCTATAIAVAERRMNVVVLGEGEVREQSREEREVYGIAKEFVAAVK